MITMSSTADQDGTSNDDGMRLAEVERACARARQLGAGDDALLRVRVNRSLRVRTFTVDVASAVPLPSSSGPDGGPVVVPLSHQEPGGEVEYPGTTEQQDLDGQ